MKVFKVLTLIFMKFAQLGSYTNMAQFNLFTKLAINSMHSFVYKQVNLGYHIVW